MTIVANIIFYSATVLIWGSTWLAIKFQLGNIAPVVSVTWRFGLAALLFPLVALLLSTFWEDYHWTLSAVGGILLILGGNWLAMVKKTLSKHVEPLAVTENA